MTFSHSRGVGVSYERGTPVSHHPPASHAPPRLNAHPFHLVTLLSKCGRSKTHVVHRVVIPRGRTLPETTTCADPLPSEEGTAKNDTRLWPYSQGQNMAVTVLCGPHSFAPRNAHMSQASRVCHQLGAKMAPNPLFGELDLYRSSPGSGDLQCKPGVSETTMLSHPQLDARKSRII